MIFFLKKIGKGVRDATVSDLFTKHPNLKKIKKFFFFVFF